MIGFISGIVKNMMFLGYCLVESLVFMVAYNYLCTYIIDKYCLLIPDSISYWQTYSLFVLIHFIGRFIKKLSPFSIKIDNSNESK